MNANQECTLDMYLDEMLELLGSKKMIRFESIIDEDDPIRINHWQAMEKRQQESTAFSPQATVRIGKHYWTH